MARARGDRVALWFEDTLSAAKLARPQLRALRQAVHEGRVRKVYVFKIDRLARSGIRDTLAVVEEFRASGCELVTVADGFSLEGPAAEVVLAVIAWAAQIERAAIGDRIAAARQRIEASGGAWGRPRAIDPGTLAKARELRKTKTIREVSAALKIPRSTLAGALSGKGHYAPKLPGLAKSPRARLRE
jgi:DNA invertase Pin-like site-specific DNA recombinase